MNSPFLNIACDISLLLLTFAACLFFIRMIKGPTIADRAAALDSIGSTALAMVLVHTIEGNQTVFIEVALVMALLSFLGTVSISKYLEKGVHHD